MALGFQAVCLAWNPGAAYAQDSPRASAVKAAFVFNFAKFTTWPTPRDAGVAPHMRLCFYRSSLDSNTVMALNQKSINNRQVEVREFEKSFPACDVMYIGKNGNQNISKEVIAWAKMRPVLLVSDIDGFTRAGGHIELYTDGGKLRFRINPAAVANNKLQLSSKLLQLADIVTPE